MVSFGSSPSADGWRDDHVLRESVDCKGASTDEFDAAINFGLLAAGICSFRLLKITLIQCEADVWMMTLCVEEWMERQGEQPISIAAICQKT